MNINKWVRGKTLIKGKLVFAGGYPKYSVIPKIVCVGSVNIYWLGAELVWIKKALKPKYC